MCSIMHGGGQCFPILLRKTCVIRSQLEKAAVKMKVTAAQSSPEGRRRLLRRFGCGAGFSCWGGQMAKCGTHLEILPVHGILGRMSVPF